MHPSSFLLTILVAALSAPAQLNQMSREGPPVPRYLNLVDLYREGRFREAVAQLGTWSNEEVKQTVRHVVARRQMKDSERLRLTEKFFRAAVMLHTDLAVGRGDTFNLDMARSLLDAVPESEPFQKQWLIAIASYFQVNRSSEGAERYLRRVLQLFPEDGEALLMLGVIEEGFGQIAQDSGRIKGAESFYRRALQSSPELVEAHLRLARIRYLKDDFEEAERELHWTLQNTGEPHFRYVAYLFQGRLFESRSRLPEAIASYRAAAEIAPSNQVAFLALSHAAFASGDLETARDVAERAIRKKGDEDPPDGWWLYQLGRANAWEKMLDALRRDVVQR